MKRKITIYEIDIPIYYSKLSIIIGDIQEATQYIQKYKTIGEWEHLADRDGIFIPCPGGAGFIFMHKYNASILIHEILHATTFLFHDRSIEISYQNDECMAYMIEYIYKECQNKMTKK